MDLIFCKTVRRCCPAECLNEMPLLVTLPNTANFFSSPGGDRRRQKVCRALATRITAYYGILFTAPPISIQATVLQPPRHAPCQLLVIILCLAGLQDRVRLKNLSSTKLELSGREHLPLPHVLLLPHGQIFPESGPDRLDRIQITTVWRKPYLFQAGLPVDIRAQQEPLVVVPYFNTLTSM